MALYPLFADLAGREVLVVGRRGPEHGAFTLPELIGLADGPARVWVDPADLRDVVTR